MPKIIKRSGYSQIEAGLPAVDDDPLLDQIYKSRGISSPRELEHELSGLPAPELMKGMDAASSLLVDAIEHQHRILVVSDYDCDGATSCCIAVEGLRSLGAENVDFIVPNRFEYGYGLSPAIVALAAEQQPDLIITVDNGISSVDGADAVRSLDPPCKLLITDHHLAPEVLPVADAIVNPNQPGCEFPSKAIAGCGVIFYTLIATRAALRARNWFSDARPEPNFSDLLDVLALGTVADVVPLDFVNRIFVHQGLRRINSGKVRPGIRALLEVGKRKIGRIIASDFGFAAGPRLNAAGRLSDMRLGIRCLLESNAAKARELAIELDTINIERRQIESEMKEDALASIDNTDSALSSNFGVCLYEEHWHEGVVGIVASRIKERLNRPVICFAQSDDGTIKGSGRSVPNFHIRDGLDAIASRHPGLLSKFGGHAMAAGLSIPADRFTEFSEAFDQEVRRHLTEEDIEGTIETDGEIRHDFLTIDLAERLRASGPWGQAFPEPSFDGVFEVLHHRVVGNNHLKMLLRPSDGMVPIDAICFNCIENGEEPSLSWIRAAYKVDVNEYRGRRALQLMVTYFEKQQDASVEASPPNVERASCV